MKLEFTDDSMSLYVKSMGKLFRVLAVADTVAEANEICRKNDKAAVIAEDLSGRIYMANKYSAVCPSHFVKDS
jgi:hypothetical protein